MPSARSFGAAGWWRVSRDASAVHKKEGKSYRQGKAKPFFQHPTPCAVVDSRQLSWKRHLSGVTVSQLLVLL
uniref:Uncharacterized protein n=1 Tax=Zea mays TaxID=4577 RepID=A0A804PJK3_MAIZE